MKEIELRKHAICSLCKKGIGHTGLPLFWTITLERFGIDMRAMERQDAFAVMMGSSQAAQIMGPNQDMAKSIQGPVKLTVCEDCMMSELGLYGAIEELVEEQD